MKLLTAWKDRYDLAEPGLGSVEIALARELTKRQRPYFNHCRRSIRYYGQTDPRGEYVVSRHVWGQAGEAGSDCDGTQRR